MLTATVASALGLLLAVTWLTVFHTTRFGSADTDLAENIDHSRSTAGGASARRTSPQHPPPPPSRARAALIAVWAAVFSCYALAFRTESPLLGFVPPLALIVFTDILLDGHERPISTASCFCWLRSVCCSRIRSAASEDEGLFGRRPAKGGRPVWASRGTRAASVSPQWPWLPSLRCCSRGSGAGFSIHVSGTGGGGLRHTIHLSSLVSIGATLRDPNAATTELFRVQTSDPSYVRMQTLDRFDGSTWSASEHRDPGRGPSRPGPSKAHLARGPARARRSLSRATTWETIS